MKIKTDIFSKSLGALQDPKTQKDMTLGDLAQMVQIMESAANAQAKLQNQNATPDFETRLRKLEDRFTRLEDRINAIYESFAGANDYD